jgi:hypothetical protein
MRITSLVTVDKMMGDGITAITVMAKAKLKVSRPEGHL